MGKFARVMKLSVLSVLSVALFTLAACTDVPPDLYAQSADAQATQIAALAALRATDQAIQDEHAQATLSAAATQGAAQIEIDLLAARLQATKDAQSLELERARATDTAAAARSTQVQAELLSRQTQAARDLQATTGAMAAQATQVALSIQVQRDTAAAQRQEQFAEFWAGFKTLLAVVVVCWLVGLASYMSFQVFAWWLHWRDLRMRMVESRSGTAVWVDPSDSFYPMLLGAPSQVARRALIPNLDLVSDLPAVRRLTASGSVLASQPDPRRPQPTITIQAIQLLHAAVQISGPEASTIPGWRDLKWSSERWQRVVAGLAAAGAVVAQPGVGTTITHTYETLNNLLYAVEMRELIVRPAPLPQMEVAE
jgi:hypothetical protein